MTKTTTAALPPELAGLAKPPRCRFGAVEWFQGQRRFAVRLDDYQAGYCRDAGGWGYEWRLGDLKARGPTAAYARSAIKDVCGGRLGAGRARRGAGGPTSGDFLHQCCVISPTAGPSTWRAPGLVASPGPAAFLRPINPEHVAKRLPGRARGRPMRPGESRQRRPLARQGRLRETVPLGADGLATLEGGAGVALVVGSDGRFCPALEGRRVRTDRAAPVVGQG